MPSVRKLANSERLALARITAPASRTRRTKWASAAAAEAARATAPAVVDCPAMSMLSLMITGMPSRGLRGPCRERYSSLASACSMASGTRARIAPNRGSSRSIRDRCERTN